MNANKALIVLLVYGAALNGFMSFMNVYHIREPQWFAISSSVVFSLLAFWWYYLDSEARAYRRSPLLNVAVVGLGIVAIPYYVVRSRAVGERLRAFAKCIGFMALLFVVSLVAALPIALIGRS